jgi:hypothetical protein
MSVCSEIKPTNYKIEAEINERRKLWIIGGYAITIKRRM